MRLVQNQRLKSACPRQPLQRFAQAAAHRLGRGEDQTGPRAVQSLQDDTVSVGHVRADVGERAATGRPARALVVICEPHGGHNDDGHPARSIVAQVAGKANGVDCLERRALALAGG